MIITYFNILGSNTQISVILNDTVHIDRTHATVVTGVVVLNTSSWSWIYPDISGSPTVDKFGSFSLLYPDNTIIVGGGNAFIYNKILYASHSFYTLFI
jgi:hypothetical protein